MLLFTFLNMEDRQIGPPAWNSLSIIMTIAWSGEDGTAGAESNQRSSAMTKCGMDTTIRGFYNAQQPQFHCGRNVRKSREISANLRKSQITFKRKLQQTYLPSFCSNNCVFRFTCVATSCTFTWNLVYFSTVKCKYCIKKGCLYFKKQLYE